MAGRTSRTHRREPRACTAIRAGRARQAAESMATSHDPTRRCGAADRCPQLLAERFADVEPVSPVLGKASCRKRLGLQGRRRPPHDHVWICDRESRDRGTPRGSPPLQHFAGRRHISAHPRIDRIIEGSVPGGPFSHRFRERRCHTFLGLGEMHHDVAYRPTRSARRREPLLLVQRGQDPFETVILRDQIVQHVFHRCRHPPSLSHPTKSGPCRWMGSARSAPAVRGTGRFEGWSTIGVVLVGPVLRLLLVKMSAPLRAVVSLTAACLVIGGAARSTWPRPIGRTNEARRWRSDVHRV